MAKGSARKRLKPKDNGRKPKKKISPLATEDVSYIDYKNVDLLRRFMSDRAKIRSRRVSGNNSQQQREVARAIKNAREMGLLAYTSRVTTQRRGGRGRDDRPSRSDRGEGDARPDRPPRSDRGEGDARPDRPPRSDRGEGDARPDRPPRSDRGEGESRSDRPPRSDRGEGESRSDRPPRSDRGQGESKSEISPTPSDGPPVTVDSETGGEHRAEV